MAFLIFQNNAVHKITDNAGQENNKRINDPLNQAQRHHIAVGNMTHFVPQNRLDFIFPHRPQKTCADSNQCAVFIHAGRKRIG